MCDPIKLARSDPGWLLVEEGVDAERETARSEQTASLSDTDRQDGKRRCKCS